MHFIYFFAVDKVTRARNQTPAQGGEKSIIHDSKLG